MGHSPFQPSHYTLMFYLLDFYLLTISQWMFVWTLLCLSWPIFEKTNNLHVYPAPTPTQTPVSIPVIPTPELLRPCSAHCGHSTPLLVLISQLRFQLRNQIFFQRQRFRVSWEGSLRHQPVLTWQCVYPMEGAGKCPPLHEVRTEVEHLVTRPGLEHSQTDLVQRDCTLCWCFIPVWRIHLTGDVDFLFSLKLGKMMLRSY